MMDTNQLKKRRVQDLNLRAPKDGTLAKCWLTISLTLQRSRYIMSGINDFRQLHFAGCIFIVVQVRFELTLERVWAVCLCQLGYRTIYLKIVARDGTAPPPDDSESPILLLYERAIKTRYCRHFSGRCASPYLSRQVSAFRRFRQFLLPISCRLYMQAVDAGMRIFLKAIILRYSTFRVSL